MGHDEGWALEIFNDVCHRECLTGTRHTHQRLGRTSRFDPLDQSTNRLGLVSRRFERFFESERHL